MTCDGVLTELDKFGYREFARIACGHRGDAACIDDGLDRIRGLRLGPIASELVGYADRAPE